MNYPIPANNLDAFLSEVRAIKPLTKEREFELAVKYHETGDVKAAHELVVSHLPFVVKIAFQYRHYLVPVPDLIQEGTIGLMKAVKRFDPYRGYRLVTFAVWWIKAYIKSFIMKSWNLVKLGTTQAQRKLFFRMGDIGEHLDETARQHRIEQLARDLNVTTEEVVGMESRVKSRERSLSDPLGESGDMSAADLLRDESIDQEALLMERQTHNGLHLRTESALRRLDPRERFIVSKRFMEDSPWTLQELGEHFGTSRERVRQLEKRALSKLRKELSSIFSEVTAPA